MINASANRVIYQGNGIATEFRYPFVIVEKEDVKLVLVNKAGAEVPITNNYVVDMVGGKITYPGWAPGEEPPQDERPSILADGEQLVIYREVPYTQPEGLIEQYPFPTLEKMADRSTILAQQNRDLIGRSLVLPLSTPLGIVANLPKPVALTSFRWNAEANGLEQTLDPATVVPIVTALKDETAGYRNDAQSAAATAAADTAALITADMQGYVASAAASSAAASSSAAAALSSKDTAASAAVISVDKAAAADNSAKDAEYWAKQAELIAKPQMYIIRFTADDQRWSTPTDGTYKLTLDTADKDIVAVMRTITGGFEQVFVGSAAVGTSRTIESLDKFAGYALCAKGAEVNG